MNPKQYKAMIANLLDHFHLTLDEVADLTYRQIIDLYFHPRKQDGTIEPEPDLPPANTFEGDMFRAVLIGNSLRMPPEEVEKLKDQIRKRWSKDGGQSPKHD